MKRIIDDKGREEERVTVETLADFRSRNQSNTPLFPSTKFFGSDVRRYLSLKHRLVKNQQHDADLLTDMNTVEESSCDIDFDDASLRQVMEPHIAKARQGRVKALSTMMVHTETAPYPALRRWQTLRFPREEFPFQQCLETLLNTNDLAELHKQHHNGTKKEILKPLLRASSREPFHQIYERFICDFIVPYLHKRAADVSTTTHDDDDDDNNNNNKTGTTTTTTTTIHQKDRQHKRFYFRYQAFPCIRVVRPNEFSIGPHCDLAYGHSIASLNFYIPLSAPIVGTNAIYMETQPGREDWQPVLNNSRETNSNYDTGCKEEEGSVVLFDGVECLHFTLENTTPFTRVSLDFRVSISEYHDDDVDHDDDDDENDDDDDDGDNKVQPLHESMDWNDRYSSPPGYYAFCVTSQACDGNDEIKVERIGERANTIDRRVGFPF